MIELPHRFHFTQRNDSLSSPACLYEITHTHTQTSCQPQGENSRIMHNYSWFYMLKTENRS